MSKKFKSQASSARAASSTFGGPSRGFGSQQSAFQTKSSPLSYVTGFPDLSAISEPRVVVAFKNLMKKDSVTKAKALEDLQDIISPNAGTGTETALLDAWISIYPRASIDNARRVRQLAHALQGSITVLCGKQIAPQLGEVVGAWLTGTFDSDKSVSRAALESLERAFPSEEKRKALWRLYQEPLLAYVEDAVLGHSPQTLSDERSTSPDDAEAKYVRVVATALLVLDQLLRNEAAEKSLGSNETFQAIINAKGTSALASHNDAGVRRSVYKLFADAVNQGIQLDWELLSSFFVAKSLNINQTGSSAEYIEVLLAMTTAKPSVWTTEYVSKTKISGQLHQYLKQGSQRGQVAWWLHLRQLIKSIPIQVWAGGLVNSNDHLSYDAVSQLLNALHEGVVNSDEPRQNSVAAWWTYADTTFWALDLLAKEEEQRTLIQFFLYPIIERYLLASSDLSQWATPASTSLTLCSSSILKLELFYPFTKFDAFYKDKVENLIEAMKLSQPESSRNFKPSQDDVIQKARRFLSLQIAIEQNGTLNDDVKGTAAALPSLSLSSIFAQSNLDLLCEAVKVLRNRNGKPYGAAGVIYIILDKRPEIIEKLEGSLNQDVLSELLGEWDHRLLCSPSAELLVSILLKCRSMAGFKKCFTAMLEQFLSDETLHNSHAYSTLLRGIKHDDLLQHPDLEKQLLRELNAGLDGDGSRWSNVYDILANQNLDHQQSSSDLSPYQSIQCRVLEDMLSGLALDEKEDNALRGLEYLFNRDASLTPFLSSHVNIGSLLTRLLLISDSPDEERANRAARLASHLKKVSAKPGDIGTGASAFEIVSRQLDGKGEALSIFSLVDIAEEALRDSEGNQDVGVASALFPTATHWKKALTPFLQLQPSVLISMITPLQGCAFLTERERRWSSAGLFRDSDGFSVALRLMIYVTRLLEKISLAQLTKEQLEAMYLYYPQALQIANDKLSIENANASWLDSTEEVVQELIDTLTKGQKLIRSWLQVEGTGDEKGITPTLASCWVSQLPNIEGSSVQAFNLARTFTTIMSEASDLKGASRYLPSWDASLRSIRSSPDVMKSAALLAVCRDTIATSALGKRLCNELVVDATEIEFDEPNEATRRLVLLNLLLKGEGDLVNNVPSQRLIFLTKHLLSISSFNEVSAGLQSELLLTLVAVLPAIKELYGDFWQDTLRILTQYLGSISDSSQIVPLHSALKLYECLISLSNSDSNEDLQEEMSKLKPSLENRLVEILTYFDETPSVTNQALRITTALLARQMQSIQFNHQEDITELYPLLSSEDPAVQGAAYGILHRSLPSIQGQFSIEAVVSKIVAHLPEELCSLLLDAPAMDLFNNTLHSVDSIWINVRRYLLSWKVVFDHFSGASHVVREAYLVDIKESGHLRYLLSFACDLLRVTSGKPTDANKYDILTFTLDEESSLEREAQWLTIHLYYLSLLHLPSLTKSWWIEQKNRIKNPLESWTQKHISPLIISASLSAVSEWITTQDSTEERALSLKINPRASEVVASVSIDPESPPISLCITLPPNYPFANALVTSVTRVAVSEQKWQSWLRTIQGIIMFSNGNLIDGLLAFRRNVLGALKGQSECAICYSVIGADMKTPDKKCATCKNMFHSACLFRWFKSSNSSSCPLCRNAFHYA